MTMIDHDVARFIRLAYTESIGTWDVAALRNMAALNRPPGIGGSAYWLLFGDANALLARWFLEALVDPLPYIQGTLQYPHLFKETLEAVSELSGSLPADELRQLARELAQLLWAEAARRASIRRTSFGRDMRLLLSELSKRCWICGASFADWAMALFLGGRPDIPVNGSTFVDFYKPRGLRVTDLRIEIEHVMALASGGANDIANLRLACGWCNRAKGSRSLIYDADAKARLFSHPTLGRVSVPQPFWVVRLLAMRGRCEDPSGCPATVGNAELTVAPNRLSGAPNPANLRVVCEQHDPLAKYRLVSSNLFTKNRF
jgi:hypothetical protein